MRRRLPVLICGMLLGLGGPSLASAAENESQAAASSEQGSGCCEARSLPPHRRLLRNEEPPATPKQQNEHSNGNGPPDGGQQQQQPSTEREGQPATPQQNEQPTSTGRRPAVRSRRHAPTRTPTSRTTPRSIRAQTRPRMAVIPQAIPDLPGQATEPDRAIRKRERASRCKRTLRRPQTTGATRQTTFTPGKSGDRGAVEQRSETGAEASAHARETTGQQGAGAAGSNDRQSADASADARSSDSSNTLLDARIGAPGNDAGFDQSVHAGAAARAEIEGPDGAQQDARAEARAEAENARNTAVELRIGSDGDSAGGSQTIAADASATATGSSAEASATAALDNPFNTFVSIRINSDGTTGPVSQTVSAQESETVNGTTNERQLEETSVSSWDFDANGIVIHFSSDGSSTDLRISVDDVTLHSPDEAPLFVWEWSMVFGAGSQPDCAITSSAGRGSCAVAVRLRPRRPARADREHGGSRRSTHERALLGLELAATAAGRVELGAQRPGSAAGLRPHLRFPARLPLALARADRGLDRPDSRRRSLHERRRCRRTAERGRRDSHRLRGKRDRAGDDPVGWRAAGSAGGVRDAVRDSAGGGRARRRPQRRCRDRPAGQPGEPGRLRGHRERRGRDRAAARPDAER